MEKITVINIINDKNFNFGLLSKYTLSNDITIIKRKNLYNIGDEIPENIIKKFDYSKMFEIIINGIQITYQRDVSNCDISSNYSKYVTIKESTLIPKADRIVLYSFNEIGWKSISQINLHKPGDKVYFITPGTILPLMFIEEKELGYLSKGVINVVKIKGTITEGMILKPSELDNGYKINWLEYLFEYNEPEDKKIKLTHSSSVKQKEIPTKFNIFKKFENLKNISNIFTEGENIFYSLKYHGMNTRIGIFTNPISNKIETYVGSHRTVKSEYVNKNLTKKLYIKFPFLNKIIPRFLRTKIDYILKYISDKFIEKELSDCIFWKTFKKDIPDISSLPFEYEFFGELYGPGIQEGFDYGLDEPKIIIFAVKDYTDHYLHPFEVEHLCEKYSIPCVKFHQIKYNEETIKKIANTKFGDYKHPDEGIVIISDDVSRWCKVKSDEYLEFK